MFDVLSCLFSTAKSLGDIRRVKICRNSPSISHLIFAEDLAFAVMLRGLLQKISYIVLISFVTGLIKRPMAKNQEFILVKIGIST